MILPDGSIPREISEIKCSTFTTRSRGHSSSHVLVLMRSPLRIGENAVAAVSVFMQALAVAAPGTIDF
jgi:hypothetical protein